MTDVLKIQEIQQLKEVIEMKNSLIDTLQKMCIVQKEIIKAYKEKEDVTNVFPKV